MESLSVSLADKGFTDINPVFFGYEDCKSGHSFGPFIRDYYLIHYVKKGTGMFYTENGSYRVDAGNIFVIKPGEITTYTADEKTPWSYIWIGFSGKFSDRFKDVAPVCPYEENTFFEIKNSESLISMREEFLASKIYEIMTVLLKEEDAKTDYVKKAQNYIKASFMTDVKVEQVAKTVGISRRYLTRLFKNKTGSGVQDYIINTKITKAKALLKEGKSVAEASWLSGFGDAFNFSKTFKKRVGVSPKDYRRQKITKSKF